MPDLTLLANLEAELHHPGAVCTRERIEALLHPDFHEIGRSGLAYTRDDVIHHLMTRGEPPTVVASDYRAALLADGCALLTYRSAHRAADGTLTHAAVRSSVWLRTSEGWRLRYHQGTPDPA